MVAVSGSHYIYLIAELQNKTKAEREKSYLEILRFFFHYLKEQLNTQKIKSEKISEYFQ